MTNKKKQQQPQNSFNQDDAYGVFKHEMEVDSNVNEDTKREKLLPTKGNNTMRILFAILVSVAILVGCSNKESNPMLENK